MSDQTMKQVIKEHYPMLSETNQKIAKFVIDNYQKSMLLGSAELASAAGVSNTAVIRFAKALGFSGFLAYKRKLKEEYTTTQKVYSSLSLMEPVGSSGYISDYFSSLVKDLEVFIGSFDNQTVDQFCQEIDKSKTLYIMGIGSDETVVTFLRNYLNIMGIRCVPVIEEGLTLREKLFQIGEGDTLLLSAFPTIMEDERWAAEYARDKGARLLLITDSEITANELDSDLFVIIRESHDIFFNSYILPMAFCNALLLRFYELYTDKTTRSMKFYDEMLRQTD